jgi:hypothetical protein
VVGIALALVFAGTYAGAQTRVKAGETRAYSAGTPHPYPVGNENRPVVWSDTVTSPGAAWLRIHFTGFDLAKGDFVTIRGPKGEIHRYEGKGPYGNGEFWSFSTDGDTAEVRIHGGRSLGQGYTIDKVGHGMLPGDQPALEVICGTDGRKDVACYTAPPKTTFNPMARLLFLDAGTWYVCTGSLVPGSNANTLITNNHCISNQTVTSTLEAAFNYQIKTCKKTTLETVTVYNGGTFLHTSSVDGGYDYTLVTLLGNPAATWGMLTPTTLKPGAGSVMLFPQHPGGGIKKLGKFEDKLQKTLCTVYSINQTYGTSAPNSQFNYGCDSEGGSSGSPILNSGGTRMWGLHHYGGVTSCSNSATHLNLICQDAGALLSCVSN